jgi:flagella basal body P-ring formation protein FlgA
MHLRTARIGRNAAPRSLRARMARGVERCMTNGTRVIFAAILLLFVASLASSIARADTSLQSATLQSLDSIRAAAENHVRERAIASKLDRVIAHATALDSRLRLEACTAELSTFTLNSAPISARTTVGVRCDVGTGWTLYVPVTVESDLDVLVLRNNLPRGATVATSDVEKQRRVVPGLGASYLTDASTLSDRHLKRPIAAGTVLLTDMFARNLAVKRGQQVLVVLDVNGITVQATGVALGDAGLADRIRVQNQTSLKIVEGIVESGNLVRVGM